MLATDLPRLNLVINASECQLQVSVDSSSGTNKVQEQAYHLSKPIRNKKMK
jgi:hypothetical protein